MSVKSADPLVLRLYRRAVSALVLVAACDGCQHDRSELLYYAKVMGTLVLQQSLFEKAARATVLVSVCPNCRSSSSDQEQD